eukprot:CAMPEP_0115642936 /NCGR_PEP_ID=MMETSP0272-20121206/37098_1 /TAXON_ID=71861 /ORGANISM="Scrippsiella trochoidea, Strain CCMP3099" /LENGTH=368 /DNA_ID=CAMNT_0003080301 /DNA_START=69 /DNA_END=1171 /DNA_ORIENTATION=-
MATPPALAALALLLLMAAGAAPGALAVGVTPVEKVITLLEDLKAEVEGEGTAEAATYDEFACFCKTSTGTKSSSITSGRDNIDAYSARIADKTESMEAKEAELQERKAKQEQLALEIREAETRCAKQKAEYEAAAADLAKAVASLEKAVKAMEDSQPAALIAVRSSVERSLALADVMGLLLKPKRQAVSAFLQQAAERTVAKARAKEEPVDATYQYHSQGIIDTLNKLLADFREEKSTLDTEWSKQEATCTATIESLEEEHTNNGQAMDDLDGEIDTLKGEIATEREALISAEAMLKDDQTYLKDLTERCESRAKDWDQRSELRAGEISALAGALELLKANVSALDTEVNKRALLQRSPPAAAAAAAA